MKSLSSLVILLQLVLQLLSNPATANNPSTQAVVQTAIGYATETLAAQTTSVPQPQPNVVSNADPTQYINNPAPQNCPTEVVDASLIPPGCPTPTIIDQQPQPTSNAGEQALQSEIQSDQNQLAILQTQYQSEGCDSTSLSVQGGEQGLENTENTEKCSATVNSESSYTSDESSAQKQLLQVESQTINPTLISNSLCQNPPNTSVADICYSTSTAMCGYQEPSVEGGHLLTMSCMAIQLCSLEHNCP